MIHHVGADRVVLVHRERDFQLRANAIDTRDKNGIAHCAEVRAKQTAKAADFSEHVRPVRLLNERLNAALEFVAKIDIYARRSVGLCFSTHGFHKPLSIVSERPAGEMTKSECRMTKQTRSTNNGNISARVVDWLSLFLRHSSFQSFQVREQRRVPFLLDQCLRPRLALFHDELV